MWPTEEQKWLLKACLLTGRPAQEAWENWTQRTDFEKIDPASYRLLPLVARNPALDSLQDPIFMKCRGVYRQTWVANRLLWKKTLPVLAELQKMGVEKIVLLKGIAMILHYYRDFGMRVIGDIDVLVDRAQISLVDSFLQRSGWHPMVSRMDLNNREHLDRWHALSFVKGAGFELDLHWSLIQENAPKIDAAALRDALPSDSHLYVLNPTDLLLQTCIHGVKYSPIPLIRWIADAVTILKQKAIDWERLIEMGKTAHICLPLSLTLQYLSEQFDAPIPQGAIQKLKETAPLRLQKLEYQLHVRGYTESAAWCRYCLNRKFFNLWSQVAHLCKFLQITARLKSQILIPFFGIYWVFKRLRRIKLAFTTLR